ncbi:MAG: FecR domain-containing protein [Tannerellaceae bacterium]|jgi:ferric-dicitrate binding protein FerR (iron transport regulator)|nr:FecR domain-containing protein [Tannerellaceae bacterium]
MNANNIRIKPEWPQSKEEIWSKTFAGLKESPAANRQPYHIRVWQYAAAVLILAVSFCSLYQVADEAAAGEQALVALPDHSSVRLNAGSRITYRPFGWFLSRTLKLEGEGYFEVNKGRAFSVVSGKNKVKVLGTVFNVYSRDSKYRVTCIGGSVEVVSAGGSAILQPGMKAICDGKEMRIAAGQAPEWMYGRLVFVETPLAEVIAEIERQYNIKVTTNAQLNHLYTGNFRQTEQAETVLEIVGKPFGITFGIE